MAAFCVVFAAVIVRLVDVQALQAGRYAAYGVSERTHAVTLPAVRGSILDRSGRVLAMSVSLTTIYADPHLVTDPAGEARELSSVLGLPAPALQQKLSANSGFEYLAHTVPDPVAAAVRKLDLPGIAYLQEPKRFEPDGTLAQSLLGQVNYDGHGSAGIEYQYDSRLSGRPGLLRVQEGIGGQAIPGTAEEVEGAAPGLNLQLTIDSGIQFETEQVLGREIVSSHAQGGTAVIMQSRTGKILALANLVADPKSPTGFSQAPQDTALASIYEPGSVMKGVTMSAALESGTITPSTHYNVPYSVPLAGSVLHDAETHPNEYWSIPDILAYSSNVGTLHVSEGLGPARIYQFMRAFGLGRRTDLAAPGEASGIVPSPSHWSGTSIGTIPIGQGVAVTALQMLDVYNTLANGGMAVPPRLVDGWVGSDGRMQSPAVAASHRVVSSRTARQMTAMLEDVVKSGTGTAGAVNGYDVAGKTGTAQVPGPRGGYEPGAYNASFVGFAPAEDPQLTAIVVVQRPTPVFYGGSIAAPVFSQIMAYALRTFQIPPPTPRNLGWDVPGIDASAAAAGSDDGPARTALPVSHPPARATGAKPASGSGSGPGPGTGGTTPSTGRPPAVPARAPADTPASPTRTGAAQTTPVTLQRSSAPPTKP